MVLLAGGALLPIAQVHVGDKVQTADPSTGQNSVQTVTATIKTLTDTDFADVTIKDSYGHVQRITSPQGHPYRDATQHAFVQAAWLTLSDKLHQADGAASTVESVQNYSARAVTYNLTVSEVHTYNVAAGASGPVLVHNCGGLVDGPLPEAGQTSLYALVKHDTGELLKWGISKNPTTRYSCGCLKQLGARMQIIKNFDTRSEALGAERFMTERFPGPLNLEDWAGSVSPSGSWREALQFARGGGLWQS